MRALAAAAIIVLLLLGGGLAVLAVMPGPKTESSVTVPVLPQTAPGAPHSDNQSSAAPPDQQTQSSNNADGASAPGGSMKAPGLSVTGLNPAVQKLLNTPNAPTAPNAPPSQGNPGSSGGAKGDPGKMQPAPMGDVTEPSPFGPLPRIADDGRLPLDVYARPSPYASKVKPGEPARVALLIEGLDDPGAASRAEIESLPPEISVAFMPYGDDLQKQVTEVRAAGHEVLLQVPLEPSDYPATDPGPHTLLTSLSPDDNRKRLRWFMSRCSGYVGLTNYMGAKFEATETAFEPMLAELKSRGLLYLDDGRAQSSRTEKIARALSLDYAVANVQIGGDQSSESVTRALDRLADDAKKTGAAIGVADAKAGVVEQIGKWADGLQRKGLVLVPVSAAVLSQV
jgi:uncharacterized protein